jgi:hypothetical protein
LVIKLLVQKKKKQKNKNNRSVNSVMRLYFVHKCKPTLF